MFEQSEFVEDCHPQDYPWVTLKWNQIKFRYMLWRVKRKMVKIPRV